MSDELLPYYNRELSFLRHMGAQFAQKHKKIAGRLRLGPDSVDDPHVSRLIEATAFLNARIQHRLDDDFPELTNAMLGVLYPHYLAPIPSMAILQFEGDPEATGGYVVERGSMLETDRMHGEPCQFRTCYPVTTWPIRVEAASLTSTPFEAPTTPHSSTCAAVLKIVLRIPPGGPAFDELEPESLRFFLRGLPQETYPLYEQLFNDVVEVALAKSPNDAHPVLLDRDCIRQVGFGQDEGMLPYP
ncbi:MAG: type VI secretion system baseplate subunit TssF, partial [Planctomycetota bacterium]